MKRLIVLRHEKDYYWGLILLLLSCLSLAWALWRDAFTPEVFLAGLLLFSWGYALLWRHDINQTLATLRREVDELRAQLTAADDDTTTIAWAQELHEQDAAVPAPEYPDQDTLIATDF
ncbi:MAG: hypothetical protein ACM3ZC_17255 [Bacteroidota bacterium]